MNLAMHIPILEGDVQQIFSVCQADHVVLQYSCTGTVTLAAEGLAAKEKDACLTACVSASQGASGCCQFGHGGSSDNPLDWTCAWHQGSMLSEGSVGLGSYAKVVDATTDAQVGTSSVILLPPQQGT